MTGARWLVDQSGAGAGRAVLTQDAAPWTAGWGMGVPVLSMADILVDVESEHSVVSDGDVTRPPVLAR